MLNYIWDFESDIVVFSFSELPNLKWFAYLFNNPDSGT